MAESKSFLGKGTIYVEEVGGNLGLLTLGNCSELNLAFNEDKKEQKDYQDAGGAIIDTVSRIDSVVASITSLNLSADNVALALRGLVNAQTGGAEVAESHVANDNAFIKLDKIRDINVAVVVKGAGGNPTYVEGNDYETKNNGVVILASGGITDGTTVELDYTSVAAYDIEGLSASGKEYVVVFDGLNEADSGNPVEVKFHRVKFNPTQALSLISDDFGSLPMTFDVLKDSSITSAGLSKFMTMKVSQ